MSRLGIFVNRQTLSSTEQLTALIKCRDAAESLGHTSDFVFPVDVKKIPQLDGLFIRANTDPMNVTYVASRMASLYGVPVIDDPRSIQICADKVNMYMHLMKRNVLIPRTLFLTKREVTADYARRLFDEIGSPLVLKEPSTSFSARVEKAADVKEFMKVAKRFLRMSDWIVVQEYIKSSYDWRIGVLRGEFLYACRYVIPQKTFKIQATVDGHLVYCGVESVPFDEVPSEIIELGIEASRAIGDGLYGVDIKEHEGRLYVIEVNDNPSLDGGEDENYPDVYPRIVSHLLGGEIIDANGYFHGRAYEPFELGIRSRFAAASCFDEGPRAPMDSDLCYYKIDFEKD